MTRLFPKLIKNAAGKWGGSFLDLLYPPVCALCEVPLCGGNVFCGDCFQSFLRLKAPFCTTCGEGYEGIIEGPFACPNCKDLRFSFQFARPACFRSDDLMNMVHRLKYGREIHLAWGLGKLAGESFLSDERLAAALRERWPLVPVPLHRRRQQERHFNQAAEIARVVAKDFKLPLLHALKRVRRTQTQTQLSRSQRLANLKGAFQLTRKGRIHVQSAPASGAVLIDDVFTTGSTVDACSKVLKKAGFNPVVVVTVMRG